MKSISKEWLALIIIAVIIIVIGVFQWNQAKPISQNIGQDTVNVPLEKEEGDVTTIVEYLKDKSTTNNIVFQIVLDTHSVDLDAFDFQKDVALEKDNKSNSPVTIDQSGSGHHRQAEVSFERISPPFTIVVMNVSNIPRREFAFTNL